MSVSPYHANSGGAWYTMAGRQSYPQLRFRRLPRSPLEWINNFLMAFFFPAGRLEIKRQLLTGNSPLQKAILLSAPPLEACWYPPHLHLL